MGPGKLAGTLVLAARLQSCENKQTNTAVVYTACSAFRLLSPSTLPLQACHTSASLQGPGLNLQSPDLTLQVGSHHGRFLNWEEL